ncbi:AAA-like domain-containing protein [Desulfobacterales bacterium HSG16]|nr:AAA-like domain-containing protein [Desulfobacterales bacterium HSG16]
MRKFSSYGPVDNDLNYYAPRQELVQKALNQLVGDEPDKGGHYMTVWASRQTGKTWVMREVLWKLMADERFHVLKLNLEYLKMSVDADRIVSKIAAEIIEDLNLDGISVSNMDEFHLIFQKDVLKKPLILILDEFDALSEDAISGIVGVFRNIYISRQEDPNLSAQKKFLLHGVALIGVRSVLGIENLKGSPFNVQRSIHIPNLTFAEMEYLYRCYERESGQKIEQEVIDRIYYETRGQPGLVSWFGELLTEGYDDYKPDHTCPIGLDQFEEIYVDALNVLPNNNILNIISKAKQEPYKELVLELFKTKEVMPHKYDDPRLNYLYMNGVIDREKIDKKLNVVKFPSPFVQKRLFNYFSHELFYYIGKIHEPFEDMSDTITEESLNIKNLIMRYEKHLRKNRDWLLADVPRRKDLRIFEAVFHFSLYEYLNRFLANKDAKIIPEFPTGNGKIDLIVRYREKIYALELKSYTDESDFKRAIKQAAEYGKSMKLDTVYLVVFVEYIPDEFRQKLEVDYRDDSTGVTVVSVFAATG